MPKKPAGDWVATARISVDGEQITSTKETGTSDETSAWAIAEDLAKRLSALEPRMPVDPLAIPADLMDEVAQQSEALYAGLQGCVRLLTAGRPYGLAVRVSPPLADIIRSRHPIDAERVLGAVSACAEPVSSM